LIITKIAHQHFFNNYQIIDFSAENKTIKVEAGTRWCDIQHFADEHNLSVKIMQTYANFTVGGALSVNCHGRYIGAGALILSVKSLDIILANGEFVHTSRQEKPDLFFACVGCYNAIAVIACAEFDLAENVVVERIHKMMKRNEYQDFFVENIRENRQVVFHNGDIYPPHFQTIRAVSWVKSDKQPTDKTRLMPLAASYPLERYFIGAFSKSAFGKWRREHIYDPILFAKTKVHWRNYEAGYDVAELEPESRKNSTYVLQEYFVPVKKFDEFATLMAEIFNRHQVNIINVSIRHAFEDSGSLLAWANEEVFAFVVWYKQKTSDAEINKVGVWTRELVDAALSVNGSYYLPYQVHATHEQFHKAYPKAQKLFDLKAKLDPDYKFRNVIWDTYYK
jgi:FAD/FMN-containing dehydrogenase